MLFHTQEKKLNYRTGHWAFLGPSRQRTRDSTLEGQKTRVGQGREPRSTACFLPKGLCTTVAAAGLCLSRGLSTSQSHEMGYSLRGQLRAV